MLRQTKSITTILDDSSSGICAAKDTILSKLNGLSEKLVAEMGDLNVTDVTKLKTYQDADQASRSRRPLLIVRRRRRRVPASISSPFFTPHRPGYTKPLPGRSKEGCLCASRAHLAPTVLEFGALAAVPR